MIVLELTEYTPARAKALRKLSIPGTLMPDMKIIWFDTVTATTAKDRIDSGIHSHSFFELQMVFSGSCSYQCADKTVSLSPGQALLIPADISHRYLTCDDGLLQVSFAFSLHTSHPVAAALSQTGVKIAELTPEVYRTIDYIYTQATRDDLFLPGIVSGRILELLYEICEQLQLQLADPDRTTPEPRFEAAMAYIQQNANRLLSCEAVAQKCGYSTKQLSRIFKNHTGKTLYEYITHTRIRAATALLLDSSKSIQQISFLMGFENESSFVSFFKRHCGLTPGNFRKQKTNRS